jgi:hypothetical protein
MAASSGIIIAMTKKPLATDKQFLEHIMSFAFGSTLAETAVACTTDATKAQKIIAAALPTVPRLCVARNIEHDSVTYRTNVTHLVTSSALRADYLSDVSAAASDMSKDKIRPALHNAFCAVAADIDAEASRQAIAQVLAAYDARNSEGLAIMSYLFASLTQTDPVYLSDSAAASTETLDQLLLATGIPDLIAAQIQPVYNKLISLLKPITSSVHRVHARVTKLKLAVQGLLNADLHKNDSSGSSSSGSGSSCAPNSGTDDTIASRENQRLQYILRVRDRGLAVTSHSKYASKAILRKIETEQIETMKQHIAASEKDLQVYAYIDVYYLLFSEYILLKSYVFQVSTLLLMLLLCA